MSKQAKTTSTKTPRHNQDAPRVDVYTRVTDRIVSDLARIFHQ